MAKYYAVRKGRTPGIYGTWSECQAQVSGFSGAEFKSFASEMEAEVYMNGREERETPSVSPTTLPSCYAFVDGSNNPKTKVFGYGGFLVIGDEEIILQGCDDDAELASMRNVAGEIAGAMRAVEEAAKRGQKELTIFFDYMGIEKWITGEWQCKNNGTKAYKKFMDEHMKNMEIKFVHVKGHTGVEGNERADKLAKEAVGVDVK